MRLRHRRRLLWAGAVLALLAVATVVGGWVWVHSDAARQHVEREASARLGREVSLERLDVTLDGLELHGLSLADPFATTPAFAAEHAVLELSWWSLAAGRVEGELSAEGFELTVRKRGAQTNLHGLRRPRSSSRPLSLALSLREGHVVFIDEDHHEQVEAFGIRLQSEIHRTREHGTTARAAKLELDAERLAFLGVAIDEVHLVVDAHHDRLDVQECIGRLQGGAVRASGSLQLTAQATWHAEVDLERVGLESHVRPLVAAFLPILASSEGAPLPGTVSLAATLQGRGLSASAMARSLQGRAQLHLEGVRVPAAGPWVEVARTLGSPPTPWRLDDLELRAAIERGWVRLEQVRHRGTSVPLPFRGRVRLSGALELEVDVLALVGLVSDAGGDWVKRYTTALPITVRGTLRAPEVRGPQPGAVARGVLDAWAHRARPPAPDVLP